MLPRWCRIAASTPTIPTIIGIPTRFELVLERRRTRFLSWTGNVHLESSSRSRCCGGDGAFPWLPFCRQKSLLIVIVMVMKGKGPRADNKGHGHLEKGCIHNHVWRFDESNGLLGLFFCFTYILEKSRYFRILTCSMRRSLINCGGTWFSGDDTGRA